MVDAFWGWLTIQRFFEFATARKVRLVCNKCAPPPGEQFSPFYVNAGDDPEGHIPWVSSFTTSESGHVNTGQSRHIPCVRITCSNCGNVDHYSMYAVKQWWDEQHPKPAGSGTQNG